MDWFFMKKLSVFVVGFILLFSVACAAVSDGGKDKQDLERVDFIHFKKAGKHDGKPGAALCYKLMGVKWNTLPAGYVINPSNPDSLSEGFVASAISTAAETWDGSTSAELFNNGYSIDYSAQYGVQDYRNSIAFGSYRDSGVIAVTSIWYSKKTKEIKEFDILFNTYYPWGDATVNPAVMDLENIATHELGHGIGLDDIYTASCSAVTMYGYSDNGDLEKRTLEAPDVTGLQKIYGQ